MVRKNGRKACRVLSIITTQKNCWVNVKNIRQDIKAKCRKPYRAAMMIWSR